MQDERNRLHPARRRGAVVSFALDSSGMLSGSRIYDPYGNLLADSADCSLGYQEDYTDPTANLVWMGARWYSPELTRFLSEDPVAGDLEEPLTRNPYPYCMCDPVNYNDPTGKRLVFSNDPSHEKHYTTESIMQEAEREGKTPGEVLQEEQDRLERQKQKAGEENRGDTQDNEQSWSNRVLEKLLAEQQNMLESRVGMLWLKWAEGGYRLEENPFENEYPSPEEIDDIFKWLLKHGKDLPPIIFPVVEGDLWFSVPDRVDIHYSFHLKYDPQGQQYSMNIYADFKNQSGENIGTYFYTVFALEGFTISPKRPVVQTNCGNSINVTYYDKREKSNDPQGYYWEQAEPEAILSETPHYYVEFVNGEYPTSIELDYFYETGRWGVDFLQMFTNGVNKTVELPHP